MLLTIPEDAVRSQGGPSAPAAEHSIPGSPPEAHSIHLLLLRTHGLSDSAETPVTKYEVGMAASWRGGGGGQRQSHGLADAVLCPVVGKRLDSVYQAPWSRHLPRASGRHGLGL